MSERWSKFSVVGQVEVKHDRGVPEEVLEDCVRRMFLLLPTGVIGKTENEVFARKIGDLEITLEDTGGIKKTGKKKKKASL